MSLGYDKWLLHERYVQCCHLSYRLNVFMLVFASDTLNCQLRIASNNGISE